MAGLRAQRLRRGLWRWLAPHPEWHPSEDDGTPTVWPRDVGCVLYETSTHAVFVDPLASADDARFWDWADERCDGRAVAVLTTIDYHRRNRDDFIARYGAATTAPDGVKAHPIAVATETMYFVPEHRALIPGDALIADAAGELSLCPASWLEDLDGTPDLAELGVALLPLVALDPELVLVSHGAPVLEGGRAALERALDAA